MGAYHQGVSNTGKLKLEGVKWGSKPSKRTSEACSKQINKGDGKGGEGSESPPKKSRVSRAEEKKFHRIVAKQAKSQYYNPDPLFRLIGEANEMDLILNETTLKALVDSGSQISTISKGMAKLLGLKLKGLQNILDIEGMGGIKVKYQGYVEVMFRLKGVKDLEEPCLFVVVNDSEYGKRVPIQIGTLHIDLVLEKAIKHELATLGKAWERGKLYRPEGRKREFSLDQVDGIVKTAETITIQPGETKKISGIAPFKGNSKRINVFTESFERINLESNPTWTVIPSYSECRNGSSRVGVAVQNISRKVVVIAKGQQVALVSAANQVPNMLAPKYVISDSEMNGKNPPEKLISEQFQKDADRIAKLWEQLDVTGSNSWTEEQKMRIKQVFEDYSDVFALNPLELGRTSLVKHTIKVVDPKPFKERYRGIPPHQFEEVHRHLKEMEEIGAIRRSNSSWASPIVLVKKKDGSLHFCIDLRKLNARTIKDAYSLPHIEESLDCLNGASIFTSLDLKLGYWQVELDDESIPLTAFTVGPLGFYECVRMPFGLTNAPATFQHLMESCLGKMHLNWCIIYLDDVIIFSKTPEDHVNRLRAVLQK